MGQRRPHNKSQLEERTHSRELLRTDIRAATLLTGKCSQTLKRLHIHSRKITRTFKCAGMRSSSQKWQEGFSSNFIRKRHQTVSQQINKKYINQPTAIWNSELRSAWWVSSQLLILDDDINRYKLEGNVWLWCGANDVLTGQLDL